MAIFKDSKPRVSVAEFDIGISSSQDAERLQVGAFGGTNHDASDMHRMGKKQELRRNFRLISMIGFVVVLQSTWENTLLYTYFGIYNGGSAGIIWMMIITWLFVLALVASLAEMASMAPTAGGQYHWVSEFAPSSFQKSLSYIVGCATTVGWIAAISACAQMLSKFVIGMILLAYPDSNIGQIWHITLLMILFIILMVGFNIFFTKRLPLVEVCMLVLHVIVFFAFLVIFWTMTKREPMMNVFTTWNNYGGWSSQGLSAFVGLSTPLWCFIGPDAGAHMSEELKNASSSLPKAMMWGAFLNGILGCIMMITFMVCGGASEGVIASMTGQPVLQAVYDATGSITGTEVMGALLIILVFFASVSVTAASSRQIWSFARDRGLPFSPWIEQVPANKDTPVNALLVCLGLALAITCINFGSDVALKAIVSMSNVALILSYIISIGCVRAKRLRGEPLLCRRWSLGKFGGVVNDLALGFLFVSFLFSFFPMIPNPTAIDMNWVSVMFGALVIFATVNYFVSARKSYTAPVSLVKKD
ncbi:Amino acid transporter [Pyrenophora tritici-repentis]|nr:Amino acid transporter [Pyrenophora tritici-repentis]